MKRVIAFLLTLLLLISLCSCSEKSGKGKPDTATASKTVSPEIPYTKLLGYNEYISDRNKGEYVDFCGMYSSLETSKKARAFFKQNSRERKGFLVTDYLNGICINRVFNPESWNYIIPEKIDGKPVIKLGSYLDKNNKVHPFIIFETEGAKEITLPKTIHYIDNLDLYHTGDGAQNRIYYKVNKANPYYATDKKYTFLYAKHNGYTDPMFGTHSGYDDMFGEIENAIWDDDYNTTAYDKLPKTVRKYKKLGKDFENIAGYEEYISDRNKGNSTSFCGITSSLENSKKAREYYKKNSRQNGNFIITNYLDGICINKVVDFNSWDGKIPEKIDGLPVIKLGSCLDSHNQKDSAIPMDARDEPSKVICLTKYIKYIDFDWINRYWARVNLTVAKSNTYYTTDSEKEDLYAIEDGFVQYAYYEDEQTL